MAKALEQNPALRCFMAESSLVAKQGSGAHYAIGSTNFELRVPAEQTGDAFGVIEFRGVEGPWTVPHVHKNGRESFYILAGNFTFNLGGEEREAGPGDFVSVAPNTVHSFRAGPGGGRILAFVPGKLEAMFIEMSQLGPEALTDPAIRAGLAQRHDSTPVR